jgi:thiamine transport system permease protein
MAATLSLIQIGINFLLMWVQAQLSLRTKIGFYPTTNTGSEVKAATRKEKFLITANLMVMIFLLISPLLALLLRAFIGPEGVTLKYFVALFTSQSQSLFYVQPFETIRNSIMFACIAAFLALALGLVSATALARASARSSALWDAILMLPLATSAVTLGFGYIITLNRPPLNLRDSLLLVPIAHALVAFPFVLRCILPAMQRIPKCLKEAATLLGASPFHCWWKIDVPLLMLPILAGIIFAFSISMGEFGATSFITRPRLPTMPIAIFRFLGQPGEMNYGQAMAMSSLLMLVCGAGFWLLGRIDFQAKPLSIQDENKQ